MQRREWLAPPRRSAKEEAAQSSDASAQPHPPGIAEYVARFVFSTILFGAIGFLFSSWFPVALGVFLFFTNDEFIEWTLQKVGIRFVPDTLGPEFIKAFVFFTGLWMLLAYWQDSAPAWLSPSLPAGISWLFIAGAALGCAVLKITSVAIVKKLLPQFGIEIARGRQSWAILVVLGVLIALVILAFHLFGF
jgi:hypothetical protein